MSNEKTPFTQERSEEAVDQHRREVVIKLGKLAAYTPPAMMALMVTNKASAQSEGQRPSMPPQRKG